jgi:hypothetical protein
VNSQSVGSSIKNEIKETTRKMKEMALARREIIDFN